MEQTNAHLKLLELNLLFGITWNALAILRRVALLLRTTERAPHLALKETMTRDFLLVALLALSGCAGPPPSQQEIPQSLQTPPGHVLFLETLAVGVQIYECAALVNSSPTYGWSFRAPEASLVNRSGQVVGRHFAGPTWELADGSFVAGTLQGTDPGPSTAAIPWLLLGAKSTGGTGVLSGTTYIQRVRTNGGKAPDLPCTVANVGQMERVRYSASYYFYRNAP